MSETVASLLTLGEASTFAARELVGMFASGVNPESAWSFINYRMRLHEEALRKGSTDFLVNPDKTVDVLLETFGENLENIGNPHLTNFEADSTFQIPSSRNSLIPHVQRAGDSSINVEVNVGGQTEILDIELSNMTGIEMGQWLKDGINKAMEEDQINIQQ